MYGCKADLSVTLYATLPFRKPRNSITHRPFSTRFPGRLVENRRPPKRLLQLLAFSKIICSGAYRSVILNFARVYHAAAQISIAQNRQRQGEIQISPRFSEFNDFAGGVTFRGTMLLKRSSQQIVGRKIAAELGILRSMVGVRGRIQKSRRCLAKVFRIG